MGNKNLLPKPFKIRLETTPDTGAVYLAGNFNNWEPGSAAFEMKMVSPGLFEFLFEDWFSLPKPLEYKFTRGQWEKEELDFNGNIRPNREVKLFRRLLKDHVPKWSGEETTLYQPSTEIFSDSFGMSPLRRKRRISVLLPYDYHRSAAQRYPVLYMLDGQNLSGDGSSYGNWELDRRLGNLSKKQHAGVIVVMIDHGDVNRLREFSPYLHPKIRKPQGDDFLSFICNTLKPAIDKHYRTITDRLHTGIGGSSMGGLFSAYAGLRRPDVFGKVMVFSPSLWIAGKLFEDIAKYLQPSPTRLYLYAGGQEGVRTVSDLRRLNDLLRIKDQRGQIKIHFSFDPRGRHQERRWGEEFEKAVPWLFFSKV